MSENATATGTLRAGVAEEVRALLGRRRMTSVALARSIGKSHTYVWRRLNGETAFDLDDMEGIASSLGVTIADLLPRRDREVTVTYSDPAQTAVDRHPIPRQPMGGRPSNRPTDRRPSSGPGRTSRVRPRVGSS